MGAPFPAIADLGFIGDRRTVAAIGRDGTVYWHCPHRFDSPSIFMGLLDPAKGSWRLSMANAVPAGRQYVADSALLQTQLMVGGAELLVTDWMTMGSGAPAGLFCRTFSCAPQDCTVVFDSWRDYGRRRDVPALVDGTAVLEDGQHLFASHRLVLDDRGVRWTLPKGEQGWTVLANAPRSRPKPEDLLFWKTATIGRWRELADTTTYRGPYQADVEASLRALRLLVFEPTGAIAASALAGLPEVIGGQRNYDYRYSWVRDTAMIVRALLRTAQRSTEGDRFLQYVATSRNHARRKPLDAVATVLGDPVPEEQNPPLEGYDASRPVRIGNRAGTQLQLGALGNFLLAAGMIYRECGPGRHWEVVQAVADFLARHWQRPDSGIWESSTPRQYTASKVFAACGLEAIAPFAPAPREQRYRQATTAIRRHVMSRCITPEGAFSAFEGSRGVDVSAALFPVWSFCAADSPEMDATIKILHRDHERRGLFKREDETPESQCEGAFLPATFWVAQYWVVRGDFRRARACIEAGLAHANDLGLFAEEVEWGTGRALGNMPLGMTHASFLSAVAGLRDRMHPDHPGDVKPECGFNQQVARNMG